MIKRALKYNLLNSLKVFFIVFFILSAIAAFFWYVVISSQQTLKMEVMSNSTFLALVIGIYSAARNFRMSNQASITRKNTILVEIFSSYLFAIVLGLILVLLYFSQTKGWFTNTIILDESLYLNFLYGIPYSISAVILAIGLMRMSGNVIGIFFNKFTRKVGLFIAIGVLFLWPILLATLVVWIKNNNPDLTHLLTLFDNFQKMIGIDILKWQLISPWNFVGTLAFLNVLAIGIYALVTRRHISKTD